MQSRRGGDIPSNPSIPTATPDFPKRGPRATPFSRALIEMVEMSLICWVEVCHAYWMYWMYLLSDLRPGLMP